MFAQSQTDNTFSLLQYTLIDGEHNFRIMTNHGQVLLHKPPQGSEPNPIDPVPTVNCSKIRQNVEPLHG
jgi:hypothetical protein